jgi:hypothetical protein
VDGLAIAQVVDQRGTVDGYKVLPKSLDIVCDNLALQE